MESPKRLHSDWLRDSRGYSPAQTWGVHRYNHSLLRRSQDGSNCCRLGRQNPGHVFIWDHQLQADKNWCIPHPTRGGAFLKPVNADNADQNPICVDDAASSKRIRAGHKRFGSTNAACLLNRGCGEETAERCWTGADVRARGRQRAAYSNPIKNPQSQLKVPRALSWRRSFS